MHRLYEIRRCSSQLDPFTLYLSYMLTVFKKITTWVWMTIHYMLCYKLQNLIYTVHSVHCTVYTVYTVYSVHCTVFTVNNEHGKDFFVYLGVDDKTIDYSIYYIYCTWVWLTKYRLLYILIFAPDKGNIFRLHSNLWTDLYTKMVIYSGYFRLIYYY